MKNILTLVGFLLVANFISAQDLDRSLRPEPGPTPEIKFKNPTIFTMPNGMKLYVVEDHKVPKVSMLTIFDFEPPLEGKLTGLNEFVGEILMSGTHEHSKDEINSIIDGMGATLSIGSSSIYAASLTRHFDNLMKMTAEVLLQSKPDPKELELLKKQALSGLETTKDDPNAQLENASAVAIFGDKHPYGEVMSPETVKNIQIEDCIGYAKYYFRPNVAYMAIVGDITPVEAKAKVDQYFSQWQKSDVPKSKYNMKSKPTDRQVVFVPKTGAVQSNFAVTYPVDLKPNSTEVLPVSVMNYILGGGSSSKLFMNLRERHGWTYGAYSSINPDPLMSTFKATAKCRNEVTDSAVAETLAEMENMIKGNFSDEDLQAAKANLGGRFSRSLENPRNLARYAINIDRYKLDKDYYKNYLIRLADVDKEDLQKTSAKYLDTKKAYIVVSGNEDQALESLKKFDSDGKIDVRNYLGRVPEKTAEVSADVTAASVVMAYINATGGEQIWNSVKDIYSKSEGSINGQTLTIEQWRSSGKLKNNISMMGMNIQTVVYADGKGYQSDQTGKKTELTQEELEEYKAAANYQLELNYEKEGYNLELKGSTKYDDKDAYELLITSPNGQAYTEYYDMKTHYKLASITTMEQQGMSMVQTIKFNDYKETGGGVVMPFSNTTIISAGGQSQTIESKVVDVKINQGIEESVFQ